MFHFDTLLVETWSWGVHYHCDDNFAVSWGADTHLVWNKSNVKYFYSAQIVLNYQILQNFCLTHSYLIFSELELSTPLSIRVVVLSDMGDPCSGSDTLSVITHTGADNITSYILISKTSLSVQFLIIQRCGKDVCKNILNWQWKFQPHSLQNQLRLFWLCWWSWFSQVGNY